MTVWRLRGRHVRLTSPNWIVSVRTGILSLLIDRLLLAPLERGKPAHPATQAAEPPGPVNSA
ncbi:hypothetical protein [uncultured Enterovirga sp.]|uniref:hypothetical protein n=1 Tax=uncultured Enterovirga sp. TaxID=2026352 RepID=UPI0035C99917